MLEYEFETVDCMEGGGGYSLFGGFGMESVRHRELICRRAADGWRYVGFVPKVQRAGGFIETIDLVFERNTEENRG
ncbi:MAG: DUF4177 domain-containing protein [Oscillibacter sp.]|nr:DUF4177 domain-containing protein [Oscillibacter sp.]